MIKVNASQAQAVVGGGKPVYTWILQKNRGDDLCDYYRYRHEQDKWGNDTGRMYWDGGDGGSCKLMGYSYTGTGVPT